MKKQRREGSDLCLERLPRFGEEDLHFKASFSTDGRKPEVLLVLGVVSVDGRRPFIILVPGVVFCRWKKTFRRRRPRPDRSGRQMRFFRHGYFWDVIYKSCDGNNSIHLLMEREFHRLIQLAIGME